MSAITDITIIGAGPVGLFAAFYAHLRNASVAIIDSLPQVGGQPAILYPEKKILDLPGFPAITGSDLTEQLMTQLAAFETDIFLNESVTAITPGEVITIETTKGAHQTRALILAIGGGAFKPRSLDLDGISDIPNVHYHVENIAHYQGQEVVILGGGDSAVDWSIAFNDIGAKTHIVHRRETFRAMEHSVATLKTSDVTVHTPYLPTAITHKDGKLHLTIQKVKSDQTQTFICDHLFVNYGFKSSTGRLKEWGLDLERHKIKVNSKQETSIPGVYAAGDCCHYPGKVDLIATGFGEAPTAVNNAMAYLFPDKRVQPKHSTSK